MGITSIAQLVFRGRQHDLERHFTEPERLQEKVLRRLIRRGADTLYGSERQFSGISTYEAFRRQVSVNTYEELKGYIDRMRHGEKNVLWPGRVKWYAKSSGTTNDKSKFIPVSSEGLNHIHYAGGTDVVVWYLQNNPKSRLFDGRALILGGSHSPNYNVAGSLVGDLSAILIENINPLVNLVRVPGKKTALISDFEEKRERIARRCLTANVTIYTLEKDNVLSVPTKALRFHPDPEIMSSLGLSVQGQVPQGKHVWVKNGKSISPVEVTAGSVSGDRTEVEGNLAVGQEVIASLTTEAASRDDNVERSPFAPGPRGGNNQRR